MKYLCKEYPYLFLKDIRNTRLNFLLHDNGSFLDAPKYPKGEIRKNNKYSIATDDWGEAIGVSYHDEKTSKTILYKEIDIQFTNGYFETDDKEIAEELEEYNKLFHSGNLIEKVED